MHGDVAAEDGQEHTARPISNSLTLAMEAVMARGREVGWEEQDTREQIADYFAGSRSPVFEALRNRHDVTDIITSNYDRAIEDYLGAPHDGGRASRITPDTYKLERKYNLYRRNRVRDWSVWHPHGDAHYPGSIQIGFEHYAGQLSRIKQFRDERYRAGEYTPFSAAPHSYRAWIEPFLWDDVHIIGFGMAEDEIDIWWVIQYWARRSDLNFGNITYYSLETEGSPQVQQRNQLLRDLAFALKLPRQRTFKRSVTKNYTHS
jgi:hypothetical protein